MACIRGWAGGRVAGGGGGGRVGGGWAGGRGWVGGRGRAGGGGGWEAEGGLTLPLRDTQQLSVSSKWHRQPQSTGQAGTVVGYSLAPHTS